MAAFYLCFSCSSITFANSHGHNSMGSSGSKFSSIKGGRLNELVVGFDRNTFCKWSAKSLALSSSLLNQVPEGLRIGII